MNEKIKHFQQALVDQLRMWLNDPLADYLNGSQGQELMRVERYPSSDIDSENYSRDLDGDQSMSIEVEEKWVFEQYALPKVYWIEYPEFLSLEEQEPDEIIIRQYQSYIGFHVNYEGIIKRIDIRTKQIF